MDYETSIIEEDCVSSTVEENDVVQEDIHLKIDRVEKKLDFLISHIINDGVNFQPKIDHSDSLVQTLVQRKTITPKKIVSLQDLELFEHCLLENENKISLIRHAEMKFCNPSQYDDSLRKLAYDVIYTFTDKSLFGNFSMNGKSRNGEKNLALRDHTIYINFIFECLIKLVPHYKYEWLESVLDVLCRNKNSSNKASK